MNPNRNKYKDLLVIVVGFCLIGLFFRVNYIMYGALALGLICIFSETVTRYVTLGWEKFGMLLGKINSGILLGVLFALMVTPIAILKRFTGKSENPGEGTGWSDADSSTVDFEKMW